jgi:cyanocobalamin reductase (cyanide-eliminating) / alkylcobalamin dealkylase
MAASKDVDGHELVPDYRTIVEQLTRICTAAGFDLVWPARVGWYNRVIAPEYRLPDLGDPGSLAVIIGNTRALWPRFCEALAADAELAGHAHPLDCHTERVIGAAVSASARSLPWELRFGHEPPPRRVAMQALAHQAGLAYLTPSHLSVHPVHGPWLALRAVAVFALPGPEIQPAPARPCDCEAHCLPRVAEALAGSGAAGVDEAGVRARWRAWLAVRDACPVGRAHRYDEAQIRYHYARDRSVLPGR